MAVLAEKNGKKKEAIVREFRSQVLDFIAMNPVGMGIQWFCPMDVGIRVANLLVAKDLFAQMDESGILDEKFNAVLIDSVEQHARFILENLEFQDGLTGNHYLFNVAGLLFCSAYLPQGVFGDQLLSFGLRELVRELFKQFFPSGGNFEGSTAYHILSTEMFLFSTALVLGSKDRLARMEWNEQIPLSKWSHGIEGGLRSTAEIPFSEEFVDRLGKAFSICEGLEKPNGEFPQIGDNDSGAFFRITPFGTFRNGEALKELYQDRPASDFEEKEGGFDENLLALHGKLDVGRVLFGERREASYAEGALVRSLMGKEGTLARGAIGNKEELSDHAPLGALSMDRGKYVKNSTIPFGKELDLSTGRWIVDQDAGFMIFRTPELFFIMNAPGGKGLRHTWGHVHNDRTGFELNVGGKDLVLDPGSYVYEALPEMRNRFRSVKAHSVPLHGNGFEQNRWVEGRKGVFFLEKGSRCRLLALSHDPVEIAVELKYRGVLHIRRVRIEREELQVEDRSDHPFEVDLDQGELLSRGYGKRVRDPSAILSS